MKRPRLVALVCTVCGWRCEVPSGSKEEREQAEYHRTVGCPMRKHATTIRAIPILVRTNIG